MNLKGMEIKLEVGEYYKARNGLKTKIICVDAPGTHPAIGYMLTPDGLVACTWRLNGDAYQGNRYVSCTEDLISEWTDEPKTRKVLLRSALYKAVSSDMIYVDTADSREKPSNPNFIRFMTSSDWANIMTGKEIEVPV